MWVLLQGVAVGREALRLLGILGLSRGGVATSGVSVKIGDCVLVADFWGRARSGLCQEKFWGARVC